MRRFTLLWLLLLSVIGASQAMSWKIGPSSVEGMDFASINDAMSSVSVTADDTLYLDQYYNEKTNQTVTKRVVIIGTGYDTSLTDEGVVATLTGCLTLKADGIVVKGLKVHQVSNQASDCTLERCYLYDKIPYNAIVSSSSAGMLHVYSCYVTGRISGNGAGSKNEFDIQNCVLYSYGFDPVATSSGFMQYMNSSTISNNTVFMNAYNSYSGSYPLYCLYEITNSAITNNIILSFYGSGYYNNDMASGIYASGSGNSIEHNILSHASSLEYFPQNKCGYGSKYTDLFNDQGKYSDDYRLSENSDAKGYATDGGEVGCHGGMFGCPADGRPQYIPYFSKVVVGSRTEDGKLPVSVTVKIQDK